LGPGKSTKRPRKGTANRFMSNDRRNRGRINVTEFTDEHSKEEKQRK